MYKIVLLSMMVHTAAVAASAGKISILDYAPPAGSVDRTGHVDVSDALAAVIRAANEATSRGEPACVYVPAGRYLVSKPPPRFALAGCIEGDGGSLTTLIIAKTFSGDLFAWSEAWLGTSPGPRAIGFTVRGDRHATEIQNALVFYDRNDEVLVRDVNVSDLHGRGLYTGSRKYGEEGYVRESRFEELRFFHVGATELPAIEFTSEGKGTTDASNEIRLRNIDVYGSPGPSVLFQNMGAGALRDITVNALRIEGDEAGQSRGDLLAIGTQDTSGSINTLSFGDLELINPSPSYAALRISGATSAMAPYHIYVHGWIGGGLPGAHGLSLDSNRDSAFYFATLHTKGVDVLIRHGVNNILLDGGGYETSWTYQIDPAAMPSVRSPDYQPLATHLGKVAGPASPK